MKILHVIAKESSGRNWVDSLLRQHPQIHVTGHSYPSDGGSARHYPKLDAADAIVIVGRDRTCQESSVTRRGYNATTPGYFSHEQNLAAILEAARATGLPVFFFSYETALLYRQVYLDWFFRLLGLEPVVIETDWRDENAKYFAETTP